MKQNNRACVAATMGSSARICAPRVPRATLQPRYHSVCRRRRRTSGDTEELAEATAEAASDAAEAAAEAAEDLLENLTSTPPEGDAGASTSE